MPSSHLPRSLQSANGLSYRSRTTIARLQGTHPLSLTTSHRIESNPNPQRDAQQDREKINPDANEYAKSGTDDTAAKNEGAAFDPNITKPQEAKKKAGEDNKVNPLDASPANPDLGQPTREASGHREKGEI